MSACASSARARCRGRRCRTRESSATLPKSPPLTACTCSNILREDWKPVLDMNAVIYGIIYIFYEPNATDPLNHEAAKLMRDDPAAFAANVRSSLRGGTLRIENKKGVFTSCAFPKLL